MEEEEECGECDFQLPVCVLNEFEEHVIAMREASRGRKDAMTLRNIVVDRDDKDAISEEDTLGKRQPSDVYEGDVNLRTLRTLLKMIDERGYERYRYLVVVVSAPFHPRSAASRCDELSIRARRSAHQLQFHSAFERCVARVICTPNHQSNSFTMPIFTPLPPTPPSERNSLSLSCTTR